MKRQLTAAIGGMAALLWLGGCTTTDSPNVQAPPGTPGYLAKPYALFEQERYSDALVECIDLARKDPLMPGLPELQHKIMTRLNEQRASAIALRTSETQKRMTIDVERQKTVPETYGLRRAIRGETGSLRTAPTRMQEALQKKVTVHLDGVNLDAFILAIGASEGINIIADKLGADQTMTMHAEGVPLQEILDYVSRNLGVAFYVGENLIWATPRQDAEPATPMLTRMYRLRKGISSEELASEGTRINIIEAVERFVPKAPGADLLFDKKAHVLIARNTRDNLAKIEEIIDTLDVCPPQVVIEARFIATSVSDLRELGIDWILNSPIVVSKTSAGETKTQVNPTAPGEIIGFTQFPNSAKGLNLSYQGLLTDPMFKAVLHALDTSGKTKTLSVPKVTTVNNRPAMIRIGEDFRYFEEYDVQSTPGTLVDGVQVYDNVLVPVGTPTLEELGMTLNVTPSVGADMGAVNLEIIPELSEFVRYEYYDVASNRGNLGGGTSTNATSMVKLPIFRRSKIETQVIVQSGETVVMGGLILSQESKTEDKVPVLSEIPIIGRLFRHDTTEVKDQNLLIFVTATILSEMGENLVPIVDTPAPQQTQTGN